MKVPAKILLALLFLGIVCGCQQPQPEDLTAIPVGMPSEAREAVVISASAEALGWPAEDAMSPAPHVVFGEPTYKDHDAEQNVTRKYGAFTVYYDDQVLGSRWAAIKLTAAMADANKDFERPRKFKADSYLEDNGYAFTTHEDYNNVAPYNTLPDDARWDRGHMVQLDDARGYGDQAGKDSMSTTNICPQLAALNQRAWLTLEQRMTEFARDYERVWIFVGPIYGDDPKPFAPDRKVPAPEAFYRMAIRETEDGGVVAVAFIMPHEPIPRDINLALYIRTIDEIEFRTGLDFLHGLPDEIEVPLEAVSGEIWADL